MCPPPLKPRENPDIDIVILDAVMPDMDGFEAYFELRQIIPKAKFLVISGYDKKGPAKRFLDAGADDFIQKPFEVSELLEKLGKLKELKRDSVK